MMQKAYFSDFISNFLKLSPDEILGVLTDANQFALELTQRNAWQAQISILKSELIGFDQGTIYFEFSIPRMGKRADVVILSRGVIYVIEFKVGYDQIYSADVRQVHDYALDLKNFHKGSYHLPIVPILIATEAERQPVVNLRWADDHVADPILCGGAGLIDILTMVDQGIGNDRVCDDDWIGSGYLPTPTIIEAAQALYQNHDVDEISRSDAGAKNLNLTTVGLRQIIHDSAQNNQKSICFVTGVPGSGKTLVGLNFATDQAMKVDGEAAVFLSGNGPLVKVLREDLARDQKLKTGCKIEDARRKVSSFVQNIHHFRDEALKDLQPTPEHVVVFDEAQRAWNKEQATKFMKKNKKLDDFDQSEPEFLVSVMDRHQDWCVIVCLVGGGQEINTGEAGLSEWMRAFEHRFDDWKLYLSDRLKDPHYGLAHMAPELEKDARVSWNDNLHLGVSMRSFRAETLSNFVAEVIENKQGAAKEMFETLKERYPIVLTRDLAQAKTWLRK